MQTDSIRPGFAGSAESGDGVDDASRPGSAQSADSADGADSIGAQSIQFERNSATLFFVKGVLYLDRPNLANPA